MTERLLVSKREASTALGISVRTLESLLSFKELKSIRVGRRRMIPTIELDRFIRRDHATKPVAAQENAPTQ